MCFFIDKKTKEKIEELDQKVKNLEDQMTCALNCISELYEKMEEVTKDFVVLSGICNYFEKMEKEITKNLHNHTVEGKEVITTQLNISDEK